MKQIGWLLRRSARIAFVGILVLAVALPADAVTTHGRPKAVRGTRTLAFGTLVTSTATAPVEFRNGIHVAMLELDWASFEPQPNVFDENYVQSVENQLAELDRTGMKVTLGLGLQRPPDWVYGLPDARYVDQYGQVSTEANFVFSAAVRTAANGYLSQVASDLGIQNFWAIRLTSGGDGEMLYPPGGSYWAFDSAALTGEGLAASMTPNPLPGWRPGQAGVSASQIDNWVRWYVGGLVDVTKWQMKTLTQLGFTGFYQTVTPGSGTRPDVLVSEEAQDLPNGTTGVGAVWNQYYAALANTPRLVVYVSSVADQSGHNDRCTATDSQIPLYSPQMDSWSATRWLSRIAQQDGLLIAGENPGWEAPAALDATYLNSSSKGMMATALRQAASCNFQVFYWAHDQQLWNGTVPLSEYTRDIAIVVRRKA